MHIGQGKRGSAQPKETCKMNLGGPSETVCNKSQAGYTIKSGVIKPSSLAHLTLATNNDGRHITPLISSSIVHVIPCSLSCDGNAIKPSIEYDPRLKRCIGLNLDVDVDFVTKNPIVTSEFLNEHIVTEVSVTSVTTLDNKVSMPCATNYMPKGGKTGTAICDSLLSTIKILQVCEACVKRTVPTEHIIDNSIACKSRCNECLSVKSVCSECAEVGQSSYLPCLRACDYCLGCGILCKRRVFLVATTDCEEGNKKAFYIIKESIADQSIDPELSLLSIIPDVPRVGKSLKAGFSNWFLKIGEERSSLAVIRCMRGRSSSDMKQRMRKLIPKNDHVRNRDWQDPTAVLCLTSHALLKYLSNVGLASTTIVPETSKFTIDNRPGMYPRPISVAIGSYGWIYVLYNYADVNRLSDLLKARLHSPVDKVTILKKQVKATSVHFAEGVVYLCGENSSISVVGENSFLSLDVEKIKTAPAAKQALQTYGLLTSGTVAQMKERLWQHKNRLKMSTLPNDSKVQQ